MEREPTFENLQQKIKWAARDILKVLEQNPDFWWSGPGMRGVLKAEGARPTWNQPPGTVVNLALSQLIREGKVEENELRIRIAHGPMSVIGNAPVF